MGQNGMFKIGEMYSREDIHSNVGGSIQSYLPHLNNRVRAICIRKELNPSFNEFLKKEHNLPDGVKSILIGEGDGIEQAASLFIAQPREPIPTFIKRATNHWEYLGEFKFCGHVERSKDLIKEYAKYADRQSEKIVGVIFIRKQETSTRLRKAS